MNKRKGPNINWCLSTKKPHKLEIGIRLAKIRGISAHSIAINEGQLTSYLYDCYLAMISGTLFSTSTNFSLLSFCDYHQGSSASTQHSHSGDCVQFLIQQFSYWLHKGAPNLTSLIKLRSQSNINSFDCFSIVHFLCKIVLIFSDQVCRLIRCVLQFVKVVVVLRA